MEDYSFLLFKSISCIFDNTPLGMRGFRRPHVWHGKTRRAQPLLLEGFPSEEEILRHFAAYVR